MDTKLSICTKNAICLCGWKTVVYILTFAFKLILCFFRSTCCLEKISWPGLAVEIRSEVRRMNEKQPVSYLCERVRVSHGMRESCVQGRLVHGDFQLALDKSVVLVYTNKSARYHLNVFCVNQWSSFRGKVTFAHLNRKSSLYFFFGGQYRRNTWQLEIRNFSYF